jgi:ferredoxin
VLKINPSFGRLVTRQEALAHARRCREAGLVHLIGRDRVDSIWLGAGPSEQLMTICNCCSCCCLFRILPDLNPAISQKIGRLPGVTVWVDDSCAGCGRCTRDVCFVDAIQMKDGKAEISAECRGCGRCVEVCPRNAIHLRITDDGYMQNAIRRISSLVDVNGRPGQKS